MTTVRNLNRRQRVIADILWNCDSREQVDKFIASLPTNQLRQEATTVCELLILATIDEAVSDTDDAKQVINRIKRG